MSAAQRAAAATAALELAQRRQLDAMIEMHAAGSSLAQIAAATGLSRPGVLKILRREGVDTSKAASA